MNDKQTYTLETFTLIREIRQRENAEPIIVATLVMPDNFVLTGRLPLRPVDREKRPQRYPVFGEVLRPEALFQNPHL